MFEKCTDDIAAHRSGKENVVPDAAAKPQKTAQAVKSSAPPTTNSAGDPKHKEKRPVSEPCDDDVKLLMVLSDCCSN